MWLSPTCGPAVALHPQLVASLGIPHAELVVDGVRGLPVVTQVHPELVLPLGCDFVEVVQPCGGQARVTEEARVTEAIASTPSPCRSSGWALQRGSASHRPGLEVWSGLLLAGTTPGEI